MTNGGQVIHARRVSRTKNLHAGGEEVYIWGPTGHAGGIRAGYGPDTDGMSPGGFKMFVFAFDCIDR